MTPDRATLRYAEGRLAVYRLSPAERFQEVEQLAEIIEQVVADAVENLEHRRAS